MCAQVSNQCSESSGERGERASPGHQVRCQALDAAFFVFHRFSISWSFRCAMCIGGCHLQSVEVWGCRGWFKWDFPQVERNCNKSVTFLWCLEAVGSLWSSANLFVSPGNDGEMEGHGGKEGHCHCGQLLL